MVNRLLSEEIITFPGNFDPITFTSSTTWVVPRGIGRIRVDCVGAAGTLGAGAYVDRIPGYGGRVQATLETTPGQKLYINVGTIPGSWVVPAYNASDIRTAANDLASRLIVAGGGGSGKNTAHRQYGCSGGHGGGLIGGAGTTDVPAYAGPGQGGTQSGGGAGGGGISAGGYQGGFGLGGANAASASGAGGAGWYGGGAGGYGAHDNAWVYCGGGGGSSFTDPTLCSDVVHTQGFNTGNGWITISMV